MTVLSTSYSTLEEAWGESLPPKKSVKQRSKAPKDPLCDLYSRRLAKVKKPYMGGLGRSDELIDDAFTYDDQFYAPYARASGSRKNATSRPPRASRGGEPIKAPALPPMTLDGTGDIDLDALPDDDDVYFERALDKRLINESDDWQDTVSVAESESSMPPAVATAPTTKPAPLPVTPPPSPPRRSSRDRLMDFGLYVASGVLLLFLLEQIFQMGMRMKLPAVAAVPPAF